MSRLKFLQNIIGGLLVLLLLVGCAAPATTPAPSPTFPPPPLPSPTFPPPPTPLQSVQPTGLPEIFHFLRTVQVTPDDEFLTGSFPRINYVPATNHFVVSFGTKASTKTGDCRGSGYVYKEYTLDMQETVKTGRLIWYPGACEAGDSGSVMVGNVYYYAFVPQDAGHPYGWHLTTFDAVNWTMLAETYFSLDDPHEGSTDPTVAFVNELLDVSDQYNPDGIWQEGGDSHHNFFSPDLQPLGRRILADTPHISGASMIFVEGVYYIITADSYGGDLVVLRYDKDWKYLGVKTLIKQANWSQGVAFDGQRFYIGYLDTRQRTPQTLFPIYSNVHLAAFDRDWNLLEDIAVTNYVPSDNMVGGRPWVILHDNLLYLSYDLDPLDPATRQELLAWQANVSIYEVRRGP